MGWISLNGSNNLTMQKNTTHVGAEVNLPEALESTRLMTIAVTSILASCVVPDNTSQIHSSQSRARI